MRYRDSNRIPGKAWSSRGFTLAEVLVAVLILAVVMAMAAQLLVKSSQTAARSRDLTAASVVARTQLDRMVEAPFEQLISDSFERGGKTKLGVVTYSWVAEVEDLNESLARIRLVVSWPFRKEIQQREFACVRSK